MSICGVVHSDAAQMGVASSTDRANLSRGTVTQQLPSVSGVCVTERSASPRQGVCTRQAVIGLLGTWSVGIFIS